MEKIDLHLLYKNTTGKERPDLADCPNPLYDYIAWLENSVSHLESQLEETYRIKYGGNGNN